MKRYLIEYANDKIKRLAEEQKSAIMCADAENVIFVNDVYNKAAFIVKNAIRLCGHGFISIDDAMKIIADPFKKIPEVQKV